MSGALAAAWAAVDRVVDPELPMLTLAELGILREVSVTDVGAVTVSVTPTYTGCPALAEIRARLHASLTEAGFTEVRIRTVLRPPWRSDWITESGRRKLAAHDIAPPAVSSAGSPRTGPVPLTLVPIPSRVDCPHCGGTDTERLSAFGATACTALWRCRVCREPFTGVKEV